MATLAEKSAQRKALEQKQNGQGKAGKSIGNGGQKVIGAAKEDLSREAREDGAPRFSMGFIKDSLDELKKVTTPTKQETVQATMVTILMLTVMALCLFLLDVTFNGIMSAVLAR